MRATVYFDDGALRRTARRSELKASAQSDRTEDSSLSLPLTLHSKPFFNSPPSTLDSTTAAPLTRLCRPSSPSQSYRARAFSSHLHPRHPRHHTTSLDMARQKLTNELIQRILNFALLQLIHDELAPRSDGRSHSLHTFLCSVSLLRSTYRDWAQIKLFHHALITPNRVDKFVKLLNRLRQSSLASEIKSVTVQLSTKGPKQKDGTYNTKEEDIVPLLTTLVKALPGVNEVVLYRVGPLTGFE